MSLPEPIDSADLDAILEMERSPGWGLVRDRISYELERRRGELEHPERPPDGLRGEIKALRTVLQIPDILKGEIKNAVRSKR